MDSSVFVSYQSVLNAFGDVTKPVYVPHCKQCYTLEDIDRFLALSPDEMSETDLKPVLWDAYKCWGTWREVSYYVPRLLQLYEQSVLIDEELFGLLLIAARPPLHPHGEESYAGDPMTPAQRRGIFAFVARVLEAHLGKEQEEYSTFEMDTTIAFLAAFDTPLAPVIDRLSNHESLSVRAHVCAFLTEHTLGSIYEGYTLAFYLPTITMLPANEAAFANFVSPRFVREYLLRHRNLPIWNERAKERMGMAYEMVGKLL